MHVTPRPDKGKSVTTTESFQSIQIYKPTKSFIKIKRVSQNDFSNKSNMKRNIQKKIHKSPTEDKITKSKMQLQNPMLRFLRLVHTSL